MIWKKMLAHYVVLHFVHALTQIAGFGKVVGKYAKHKERKSGINMKKLRKKKKRVL